MVARYQFKPVTEDAVQFIAENMRQADKDEVTAFSGSSDIDAILRHSIHKSVLAAAIYRDEKLLCIAGASCATMASTTGQPWMLGTDDLYREPRLFVIHGKRVIDEFKTRFTMLENYVDARNSKSIRWLRWLGFTIHNPVRINGVFFHRFSQ